MVQRYNPDYVMHAARFAPFARENEHGEYVKFSDYEALESELAGSRQINAQTLQVKLTMAETIKELTDRLERLSGMLTESRVATKSAEERADALAVENQDLKSINDDRRMFVMNGVQLGYIKVPTVEVDPALETIRIAVSPQVPTPATDAALAAIEARGVEKAAAALDALSAQSASATTQGNFRAAAVYLRTTVLPAIGEAK